LYEKLHPGFAFTGNNGRDALMHSYERRLQALYDLKSVGYLLGSGVMIGLPFQRYAHLEEDLQFLRNLGVDMVGMGPWIPHPAAPLSASGDYSAEKAVELTCRMIALTRLYLHEVNIVSATALEALAGGEGRGRGIEAGANVVMPNFTPCAYRSNYDLYPGKAECGR
jgi:biotin synthase